MKKNKDPNFTWNATIEELAKLRKPVVSKNYVIAMKTIGNIIEGKTYELVETIYMGAYIIDESGKKQYYKYGDFNFC